MKGYPKLAALLLVLASGFTYLAAQSPFQEVVFENVFSAITTAQVSSPFRNVGQAMHTLQVTFPSEVATVTGIQIRLEWCSYDCETLGGGWKPMGPDITEAPVLDNGIAGVTDVYAYTTYYGVFRSMRADMVTNTPGGEQLTARYTGAIIPVVPFVTLRDNRWAF
jgi:hypothetical protein